MCTVPCPSSFTQTQLVQLRQRETKWLEVISNWNQWMSRKPHHLRERCRKGIPPAVRPRVWQYLCGSHCLKQQNPGEYQRDIHRQFPNHELFNTFGGCGQQALFNVLMAYCSVRPEVGYCQAHAPIASALLIHMPEEEAFWTFLSICDEYLRGYFDQGLVSQLRDLIGDHLNALFRSLNLYSYLLLFRTIIVSLIFKLKHSVEPMYFAIDWLMCLLTRNLPWATVLRVLDMFFFEGKKCKLASFYCGQDIEKTVYEILQKNYPRTVHQVGNTSIDKSRSLSPIE
ncbi:unnamed protein product [Echinostoma caproni]|uniref:Rab-GAP TBC domain-containing protein n=1 Tax=Echinostoma caproni TaxID=27848 RepID=A0A183AMB4_9TREM|nr:unnamed protein product [Echinostoma caproni]